MDSLASNCPEIKAWLSIIKVNVNVSSVKCALQTNQAGFIYRVVRKNPLIKTMLGQQGYFNFWTCTTSLFLDHTMTKLLNA